MSLPLLYSLPPSGNQIPPWLLFAPSGKMEIDPIGLSCNPWADFLGAQQYLIPLIGAGSLMAHFGDLITNESRQA